MGTTEFRRFSLEEVNAGEAEGWTFAAGWFRYHHVPSAWAWFSRPAVPGSTE